MLKQEFEALALRGEAEISPQMYEMVERFYMSEDSYHRQHGGIEETKQEYVKRVFGGKINTPRTIARKIADEASKINRWYLSQSSVSDDKLDKCETVIRKRYDILLRYGT